jgi:hypothetical protein
VETRSDEGAAAGAGDDLTPWGLPERRDHSKRVWLVVVLAVAGLVAVRFWDSIAAPFRDTPVAAFVALLPAGESVARDGHHRLDAGARFRLFAVLEARTLTGATVWYTEAPALRLGGREVPGDRLRRWPESGRLARVRWWTVEGFAPYLQVATADDLERFRLPGNFHPDWGSGWSIDGVVDPRNALLEPGSPLRPLPFGTQRWQVRIEIYAQRTAITPEERLASPGGDELLAGSALPTTLVAALPAPLARLSEVFGVTQVEAAPGLAGAIGARIDDWRKRDLAFERAALLREHLVAAGVDPAGLTWRPLDLDAGPPPWRADAGGEGVAAGDLVQGGGRIVVLFRDQGEAGRLDRADLVFDYFKGARVRRLDDVFREEGGLVLDWASTHPVRPGA